MTDTLPQPVGLHGLTFDISGISEQGPRSENQDAFTLDEFGRTGIVAVADGMGGERSGRTAADTALASIVAGGGIHTLDEARRTVREADAAVAEMAQRDPDAHAGMGCALGLLSLTNTPGDGTRWIGAHVGDVRILSRSPDGAVRLETRDHTPAFARWEAGEISLDEIPDTAGANRLQRAVGRGGEADVTWLPVRPGWAYLIISDGVYKAMRMDELAEAMSAPSAGAGCEAIRRKVEERGPDDNYTAVLVRVLGDAAGGATSAAPRAMNDRGSASSGNSAWSAVLAVLSLLALAAAGYAYWTAQQLEGRAAGRADMERLRVEVDSLRDAVTRMSEPFGPGAGALPDTAATAPLGARP